MAVWRTKVYSLFGFNPRVCSRKTEVFADLVELARSAIHEHDHSQLDKIVEYVSWATDQKSDELASVVDLAFFLPVLSDPEVFDPLVQRFPKELVNDKRQLLMSELPND